MSYQSNSAQAQVDWSTKLFGCFSDKRTCCLSCVCPCVVFGQITDIVNEGKTPAAASGICYVVFSCIAGPCLFSAPIRTKMRNQYNLKGNVAQDCLVHCCCEPCALTQEYHELQKHGFDPKLGWKGNSEKQKHQVAMAPVVENGMRR